MKGLLGRLCGSKRSDLATPHSPLRGAGRKRVGDLGDGNSAETSHVRFQDSDLGKVTNYTHIVSCVSDCDKVSAVRLCRSLGSWYLIVKPWSKSWSKSMSQQIPKLIKVLQKKKIEEFGPRADTKITWATHPPTPPHKPKCLEYTRGVEVKTK